MTARSFRAPGDPRPEKPPVMPVFLGANDPPTRRVPRKEKGLVIGKPWPAGQEVTS